MCDRHMLMYVKKIVEKSLLRPRVKNLLLHFFASFVVRKSIETLKKRKKI